VSQYFSKLSKTQKQEKTIEILETCGINCEMVNYKPSQFSGGQRQRVSIARALASNPQLLICDEAVSALDISVQAQILNLLKKLQLEFSLTILFITHDMVVARYLCDRIAVLKNGNLLEINTTNNIFNTPENNYTKELITHLID
jgi:ABC-type oligopeptide transport system ATPase subunit